MSESVDPAINTKALRALYDNLGQDAGIALAVNEAVLTSREADFRGHFQKEKRIKNAIKEVLADVTDEELKSLFEIIKEQNEY